MKIAIHQPEHFPYLGFFQKMQNADIFVILDDVQYTKNNFQNRNRFINKNGVIEWFTITLEKSANKKLIKDVTVNNDINWKSKVLNQLQNNFKIDFSMIYNFDKLVDINLSSINYCREKLNIITPMLLSSELNITTTKSQKLADICKKLNATEYISGSGGKSYLDESLFDCKISYFQPQVSDNFTTLQHLNHK